ncbi:hypothetical protein Taro_035366 [Colocasia esculenta]|uniref:MRN complex-interacting protein N-terminal domain-containing protein n=1 Tax=Colocasia esculenta TaxID=4460 RepID=A0A843WEN9_COLES|nr:hypothetical protein [Colocasia esculenta]
MTTQQAFIALQCCQCSTMQVKQQKRSSNKWVCAVCNQRQSVRKIFARSCLARDVRGFVQRFNMSRMTAGETDGGVPAQIGDDVEASPPPVDVGWCRPRRTDWSEYLDPDDGESTADALSEAISDYPGAVTDLPTEIVRRSFQKREPIINPRKTVLKDAFKPSSSKRKLARSPQPRLQVPESVDWKKRPKVAPADSSKWSEYLQEDPAETHERMDPPEPYARWGADGDGDGQPNHTRFEEEVHPDFL